jgi:outer membrane murein-binding lipoprotein Lpp
VSSDGGSFGHLGVHVGSDWWVRCNTYADHPPILNVHVASTNVSSCIANQPVGTEAVEFARALARDAQRFAAEVERLHSEHQAVERARMEVQAAQQKAASAA